MSDASFHDELLESDDFANYSLRSTFFFRGLRTLRLWDAIDNVRRLSKAKNGFSWDARADWGIENEAWDKLKAFEIDPLCVFCHPRVIGEQPWLLLYYRTVSLVSQKGVNRLVGGDVKTIESGKRDVIDDSLRIKYATTLNSIASAVIIAASKITDAELPGIQFAAAGATLQGSWNNAVGKEGEAVVRTILLNRLRDEITQIVWKDRRSVDYSTEKHAEIIDNIHDVRVIRLRQGFHLLFSSEPDVSVRDVHEKPVMAIEVKAGTDTAGALERLGAAMKSFENDRSLNPRVKTVYVVRAMTPELRARIDQTNPFDYTFGLAELLANEEKQRRFASLVLRETLGQ